MSNEILTKAVIKEIEGENFNDLIVNIPLRDISKRKNLPYILIIQSTTEVCTKITIYPIQKVNVIKISMHGKNVSEEITNIISNALRKHDIIHTSGLIVKQGIYSFECYLNLSLKELNSLELKNSLNKIKKTVDHIRIEEVKLTKNKND
ncbi:MAG: hypothetical protein EU539_03635 [Promethearchaeota archaeon]|nr:MAG: hypothetical protein EU539_03635 [Candidatus Lokiarchaeota archaeon]